MTDPFDELRAPIIPLDPDPSFAARLRSRVERAFDLPRGVTVSNLTVDTPAAPAIAAVTPYLAVAGADRALDWYADAFGARRRGEPIVMPDGRIGHAELEIAGGVVMLSEEHPEIGVVAPVPGQGVPVTIHLEVADVDAVIGRAVEAGADLDRPAADYDYGRNGVIRDPFGHRWLISGPALVSAPAAVSGRRWFRARRRCRGRWPVWGRTTATSATCRSGCPTWSGPPSSTRRCSAGSTGRAADRAVARYRD